MNNTETTIKQNLQAESPTVEAETQASARLVLPPDTPFQEVSTATLVTVDNTTNTIVDTNQCDSEHTVYVEYNYKRQPDKKAIKSIYLKIRQSGAQEGLICLCNATKMGTGNSAYYVRENIIDNTNAVQELYQDGVYYSVINITDKLPNAQGVFALVASGNAEVEYTGSVTFETQVVPYVDIMEQSAVLQKELSENTQYEVNLLNGRLFATTQLYSATGNLMPAQLSLTYNEAYNNAQSVHGMPLFAKGWKLNYQQCVVFNDDNTCTYVDGNFKERLFKHAGNSTNVYYDFDGKTGMKILKCKDNSCSLVINDNNTIVFDANGRATMFQTNRNEVAITTTIVYGQDGLPSTITDGAGGVVTIEKSNLEIIVKYSNAEVARLTTNDTNNLVGTSSFNQSTVAIEYEDSKISTLTDCQAKKQVCFSYNTAHSVVQTKVYSCYNAKEPALISTHFFEYKALETSVYVSQATDQKSNACFKMHYVFAENGDFMYKIDSSSDSIFSPVFHTSKEAYKKDLSIQLGKKTQLTFDGAAQAILDVSADSSENSIKATSIKRVSTNPDSRKLVVGAQVKIVSPSIFVNDENVKFKVTVERLSPVQDPHVVCEKFADLTQSKWQAFSVILDKLERNTTYEITLEVISNNLSSSVYVNNAYIAPYHGTISSDVISFVGDTIPEEFYSQPCYVEHINGSENYWFAMKDVALRMDDGFPIPATFTYKDYLLTSKSRSQNQRFNVFYNDGKDICPDVEKLSFVYGSDEISFESIKMATVQYNEGLSFVHIDFSSNGHTMQIVRNLTEDSTVHTATSLYQYSETGLLTSYTDEAGIETRYQYDAWGNCIEEKVLAPNQSLNIVFHSNFGNDGKHLCSDTAYRNDEELTSQYQYVNGLVSKQIYPNGQTETYTYDTCQRLIKLSSTVENTANENSFAYFNSFLAAVSHNNTTYAFDYDDYGNVCEVTVGNDFQWNAQNSINTNGTKSTTVVYGNNQSIKKHYDKFGRLVTVAKVQEAAETPICHYVYSDNEIDESVTTPNTSLSLSENSKLRRVVDIENNIVYNYTYDDKGNASSVTQVDKDTSGNTSNIFVAELAEKDVLGNANAVKYKVNGDLIQQRRVTKANPLTANVDSESAEYGDHLSFTTTYTRDGLNRYTTIKKVDSNTNAGYQTQFQYAPRIANGVVAGTTPFVSKVTTQTVANNVVSSTKDENVCYDTNGNITQYGNNFYQYDGLNRLVREDNLALNKTFTWAYDAGGNITSKKEYSYTTGELGNVSVEKPYTYGSTWKDQLVSFNGSAITYDQAGNPLSYKGNTFEWQRGRLLTKATLADGTVVNMTYYANGLRASKQVGNATHKYYYDSDGNIIQIATHYVSGSTVVINFTYDGTGVTGFVADGKYYYFVKNLFGDVTDLYCGTAHVAHYTYDAWGNHTVTDQYGAAISDQYAWANVNPFRYRGYYYDVDLGLYYLQSRYYDPQTGRFINADTLNYLDPESINGLNLYCYCYNNPVSYTDPSGHAAISIGLLMAIGAIVGAVIGAGASVAGQYIANGCSWENFSWGQLALDTVLGGVSGLLSMSPLGWGAMVAANAGLGFVGAVGGHLINGSDFSKGSTWLDIGLSTGLGALVGLIGGPGALNAGYLNGAKKTAGFIRAAGMYDDVLTKSVTGYYRTPGIASNALRLSSQNLVKQWNKMVVGQAGKALTKALAYGGAALLIGTAGKGWLYDWYNDYF